MAKTATTTTTKVAPKPSKMVITLGITKKPGLAGTIGIKTIDFDDEASSLLFGRHIKVCIYVNEKTQAVVPVLLLDNSSYGPVVETRLMSGNSPHCVPRLLTTQYGNQVEFIFSKDDILKAMKTQTSCDMTPPAATNGSAAAVAAAPPKKKAPAAPPPEEPEEEPETEEEEETEEGEEVEDDDAETEEEGEEETEGEEAEGEEEEDDGTPPDFDEFTKDTLIDAAKQLDVKYEKSWSEDKLRKAVSAAYDVWKAEQEASGGEEEEGEAEEGEAEEEEVEGEEEEVEGEEEVEEEPEEAPAPPPKKKKPAPAPPPKKKKKVLRK